MKKAPLLVQGGFFYVKREKMELRLDNNILPIPFMFNHKRYFFTIDLVFRVPPIDDNKKV
jgi:hypothetical protein